MVFWVEPVNFDGNGLFTAGQRFNLMVPCCWVLPLVFLDFSVVDCWSCCLDLSLGFVPQSVPWRPVFFTLGFLSAFYQLFDFRWNPLLILCMHPSHLFWEVSCNGVIEGVIEMVCFLLCALHICYFRPFKEGKQWRMRSGGRRVEDAEWRTAHNNVWNRVNGMASKHIETMCLMYLTPFHILRSSYYHEPVLPN